MPGFLLRFGVALVLVLLTYNPSGVSFVHWLRDAIEAGHAGALHGLAGIALIIGWTVFLRTAWASLGMLGLALGATFLAAVVWVLIDFDLVSLDSASALAWVVLVCVALLLAVGMSFGTWQRRASGQVDIDDVES
ncbi:MAG: hypothetical protein IT486_10855 [Gammaproteobacteria bacterium]|nr:hypothetical protein [Gammaproteobacteria bacterium]